jgi:alpha-mannosidase
MVLESLYRQSFSFCKKIIKMNKRIFLEILVLFFAFPIYIIAQDDNPNLITRQKCLSFEASSTIPGINPMDIAGDNPDMWWETDKEKEGAWIDIKWREPQKIKQLWIINKASPKEIGNTYDVRAIEYFVPRKIEIIFSEGTSVDMELRLSQDYQIITLPAEIITSSVKLVVKKIWDGSGINNTGLCKVKAFSKSNSASFRVSIFEMYDVLNDKPVQSAKIQIVNPGNEIKGAKLLIMQNGKDFGTLALNDIPTNSATVQQIWIPAVYTESNLIFRIKSPEGIFTAEQNTNVKPYSKNYFDGGTFDILNTNHNDLGFLNTQSITADYRSSELIVPAMDLMKKDPDFKYTMESVEYLKEFLARNPGRKDEMAKLMQEKRFVFGASYIQCLQVHVGQEKLIRQFYYGRRWLRENFPGCDTRFYMNTDVPGLTYQLPQILKKSGIDYIIQGRMAWGFYYWEGLDKTSIPMFAFRYDGPLLNPLNNTGWLNFLNEREYYYMPRQIPKTMLYDFNSDYLPPCPEMIPFAKNQNIAMKKFASIWNDNFKNDPEKLINPPAIRLVEPEGALKEIFGKGEINIETIKGDWPMTWAYYDEPGHREGLLTGRKGLHELINAEGLYSLLTAVNKSVIYPKDKIDSGWLANCWPDHGWGGNRGIVTDSFNVASYEKSLQIGTTLTNHAGNQLLNLIPQGDKNQIPVVVYNTVGWERTEIASCMIHYPKNWKGLEIKDENGNNIPVEIVNHFPEKQSIEVAFLVKDIPSFGFKNYYATAAKSFPKGYVELKADSVENDMIRLRFGSGGIASLYDKVTHKEILRTDKFFGGEVVQLTAPDLAWESFAVVNMKDFDKTSLHDFKTIRAVESPIRYIIEKEAKFKYFTLRERFILNKHSRELVVDAEILDWTGEKEKELRIVFPVNMDKSFRGSYEVPFGTVEMGHDEIDYSYLPDNYGCQFNEKYARKDLPFREAINWVDVSTGNYKGNGCLFASDMTVHLFRDETDDPVVYPVVQHVLLSSRKSLAWNPDNWFTQAGSHSYRMALYPHDGNWRFAFKEGLAFNSTLKTYCGKGDKPESNNTLPLSKSLISVSPANLIVSALKEAEDGDGLFIRFYEAEGRYTKAIIKGFRPFSHVSLTDMLEYKITDLPVEADGSVEISVKPWEIVNIKILKF